MQGIFAIYSGAVIGHAPFALLLAAIASTTCWATDWLYHQLMMVYFLRCFLRNPGGTIRELHASGEAPTGLLGRLRSLVAPGWLPRLLGDGDLSSTRFVFLGAFGVASLVLVALFAAICWRYLHTGTLDTAMSVLAAGTLGTFLGFAANAQNTKNTTTTPGAD